MSCSSNLSERTFREIYLPTFETAVKEAQPKTIMCSYNKINGVYASENKHLLTEILRDEWGFEGYVMTDWGAVADRVKGIVAGLDLEMPGSHGVNDARIIAAVKDGNLDEAFQQIDYETIGQAIQDMFPGFTGYYFMHHFMPYLQMRITTPEQQAAYQRILTFLGYDDDSCPAVYAADQLSQYKLNRLNLFDQTETMEKRMRQMIEMSDHDYEKLKKQVLSGVKMKTSFPMKYHPAFVSQRKFMKRLQDAGYNDILFQA